jgi:hypothetical protein
MDVAVNEMEVSVKGVKFIFEGNWVGNDWVYNCSLFTTTTPCVFSLYVILKVAPHQSKIS